MEILSEDDRRNVTRNAKYFLSELRKTNEYQIVKSKGKSMPRVLPKSLNVKNVSKQGKPMPCALPHS